MKLERFRRLNAEAARAASEALERLAGGPVSVRMRSVEPAGGPNLGPSAGRDEASTGIYLPIRGSISGSALLCFPRLAVRSMSGRLTSSASSARERDAMEASLLKEVGNIICGHYLTVLANELHSKILPGLPSLKTGSCGELFDEAVSRLAAERRRAWIVDVEIEIAGRVILGRLLLALRAETIVDVP